MPIRLKKPSRIRTERFRRVWGCPLTKNRTQWCFALCVPKAGMGDCGRIAPHSLMGRTDGAILRHMLRRAGNLDRDETP